MTFQDGRRVPRECCSVRLPSDVYIHTLTWKTPEQLDLGISEALQRIVVVLLGREKLALDNFYTCTLSSFCIASLLMVSWTYGG